MLIGNRRHPDSHIGRRAGRRAPATWAGCSTRLVPRRRCCPAAWADTQCGFKAFRHGGGAGDFLAASSWTVFPSTWRCSRWPPALGLRVGTCPWNGTTRRPPACGSGATAGRCCATCAGCVRWSRAACASSRRTRPVDGPVGNRPAKPGGRFRIRGGQKHRLFDQTYARQPPCPSLDFQRFPFPVQPPKSRSLELLAHILQRRLSGLPALLVHGTPRANLLFPSGNPCRRSLADDLPPSEEAVASDQIRRTIMITVTAPGLLRRASRCPGRPASTTIPARQQQRQRGLPRLPNAARRPPRRSPPNCTARSPSARRPSVGSPKPRPGSRSAERRLRRPLRADPPDQRTLVRRRT